MRDHLDLSIADLGDADVLAKVAGAALDLDAVVEELLKGRQVKDLIADGLAAVDGVLVRANVSDMRSIKRREDDCFVKTYLVGNLCAL